MLPFRMPVFYESSLPFLYLFYHTFHGVFMNLTVKFEGHIAEVIKKIIGTNVVGTKTEELRLAVLALE